MHVLIAFLTAVAGLLYALERVGVDLGWFNPWAWKRRRKWIKQLNANPAFGLERPIDAIALLATATAKIDGDLSIDEKNKLKEIFVETFNKSEKEATELLGSSVFMLGSGEEVYNNPKGVLAPSLSKFTNEQNVSSLELLSKIANVGGQPSAVQVEFINNIKNILSVQDSTNDW